MNQVSCWLLRWYRRRVALPFERCDSEVSRNAGMGGPGAVQSGRESTRAAVIVAVNQGQ